MIELRSAFKLLDDGSLNYLDSAATSLKPKDVIERICTYYEEENGSPHRGAHKLSIVSTQLYNASKDVVKDFVHAGDDVSVIYTKNTTEALNLVASSLKQGVIKKGDNIVITITSHHSNILPWQKLARINGAELRYLYTNDEGYIFKNELDKIDERTKIVSMPLVSNGIGAIHDARAAFTKASSVGAIKIADAAQAVGHIDVDFTNLDVDFLAFSGHKIYGAQGIGSLVAKNSALDQLDPFLLGGDMIEYVTEQTATFAEIPTRFEAGTQNVVGAVGQMAAIQWMQDVGLQNIYEHNKKMTDKLYKALSARDDIIVYGPKDLDRRGSLVTFNVKDIHPHDVASILDASGVAIRAGHHCCQPLMAYSKCFATCRASIGVYNNSSDIKALLTGLDKVQEVFNGRARSSI